MGRPCLKFSLRARYIAPLHPNHGIVHTYQHAAPLHPSSPHVVSGSLGAIVRSFKSATTKRINLLRETPGAVLWQRNYHEHIIRDQADENRIRGYIVANPQLWKQDSLWSED